MVEYEQKRAKMVRVTPEIMDAMEQAAPGLGTVFDRSGGMNFQATFDALVPLGLAAVGCGDVKALGKAIAESIDREGLVALYYAIYGKLALEAAEDYADEMGWPMPGAQVGG